MFANGVQVASGDKFGFAENTTFPNGVQWEFGVLKSGATTTQVDCRSCLHESHPLPPPPHLTPPHPHSRDTSLRVAAPHPIPPSAPTPTLHSPAQAAVVLAPSGFPAGVYRGRIVVESARQGTMDYVSVVANTTVDVEVVVSEPSAVGSAMHCGTSVPRAPCAPRAPLPPHHHTAHVVLLC